MANVKISDLTAASTPLDGTELFEVVQSGTSYNCTSDDIAATNRAYASYYSVANQTGDVTVGKAVKFASTFVTGINVSVANNGTGDPTRVTLALAGTYQIISSIHAENAAASDYDCTVWFKLNGTDVVGSADVIVVPKTGDGGHGLATISRYITVTAAQYIEMYWLPENASVTMAAVAAVVGPPAFPSQPSATIQILRIGD